MVQAWGLFAASLVLLGLGGYTLVKGIGGLAQKLGISAFTAGLLLTAFGTSLPELFVNGTALWQGLPGLALGNAVGSNLVNLGLTLPLAALGMPLLVRMRLLSPLLMVLIATTVVVMVLALDGHINRVEGGVLLAGFVVLVVRVVVMGRVESAQVRAGVERYSVSHSAAVVDVIQLLIGVLLLGVGAWMAVDAMENLAPRLGLSPLMAGLLPLAIGTALPEIAAAMIAARRGQGDMVVGQVIGSSLCNLLLVIGAMAAVAPLPLPRSFMRLELPAAIALAVILVPILRGDLRISRGEAAVLLLAFIGWLVLEVATLSS